MKDCSYDYDGDDGDSVVVMVVGSHEARNVEMKWIEPILAANGSIVCLMVLIKRGCHLVHTEEITQADDDGDGDAGGDGGGRS